MRSMLLPFKRYAEFSGRSDRKEYWMYYLFLVLCNIPLYGIALAAVSMDSTTLLVIGTLLSWVFGLGVIVPSIALNVRRLHDTGKSGWLLLVALIPLVGVLVIIVLALLPSTPGQNAFGAPYQRS